MKTNLLKLAAGLCFALGVVNSANAQTILAKEDFEYTAGGPLSGKNGGTGWNGAWDASKNGTTLGDPTRAVIQAGNFTVTKNSVGNQTSITGGYTERYRDLLVPIPNVAGTVFWARFSFHLMAPTSDYSGLSFFNGETENGYFGQGADQLISSGNTYPDKTFNAADKGGSILGKVSVNDPHNYLVRISFEGSDVVRYDLWADYNRVSAPLADVSEPTFQLTGYRNDMGGVTQVRLACSVNLGAYPDGKGLFDAIKLTNTYAPSYLALEDEVIGRQTSKESNASFYPNPVTNGKLTIEAKKESLKSVSIFDLSGKKVASKPVNGQSTEISTQGLAKGVYILEVSGSKSTSRNKLVID